MARTQERHDGPEVQRRTVPHQGADPSWCVFEQNLPNQIRRGKQRMLGCYDVRSFLGILEHVLLPLPACGSNLKTGSSDAVTKCPSVLQTLQAITKLREGLVFCTKAPERQGAEPRERNGWVCILQSLPWLESFSASV